MAYNQLAQGCLVRIYNDSGAIIPAGSMAKIKTTDPWDNTNHRIKVVKPDADNIAWSSLIAITEEIPIGKAGLGYIDGIFVIKMTSGETIAAGDKVGSDNGEWTVIKIEDDDYGNNDGQFFVIDVVDTDYLILRPRMRESLAAFNS